MTSTRGDRLPTSRTWEGGRGRKMVSASTRVIPNSRNSCSVLESIGL